MENNKDNQINIELTEDVASGIYSNLSVITHSPGEFVCDFIQMMPGVLKGKVKSRIVMTPQNTKRFMKALIDNMQKYEANFGVINDFEPVGGMPPMNFGGPATEA